MSDLAFIMAVPISGIVFGVVSDMLKRWTKHKEEMARIRNTNQASLGETAQAEFNALRSELARLRDTTTQYDMSVEHAMTELKQRVAQLETKARGEYRPTPSAVASDEAAQPLEQRIV